MKRVIVLYGEGFSEEEIQSAKHILEKAFEDWEDTFVLLTNKKIETKKVNENAWETMEKDLDG